LQEIRFERLHDVVGGAADPQAARAILRISETSVRSSATACARASPSRTSAAPREASSS